MSEVAEDVAAAYGLTYAQAVHLLDGTPEGDRRRAMLGLDAEHLALVAGAADALDKTWGATYERAMGRKPAYRKPGD